MNSEGILSPGESLVMWIHLAILQGMAVETTERIEISPEYLETVGHLQSGDVIALDVGCEGVWLATAKIYRSERKLIFEMFEKLYFVLPILRGQLSIARYLALSQNGKPLAPPLEINPWDKNMVMPEFFGSPFFFMDKTQ